MKTTEDFQRYYHSHLSELVESLHVETQRLLREEISAPRKHPKMRRLRNRILLFSIPIVLILFFTIPLFIIFYAGICYLILHIGGRMGVSEMEKFRLMYKNLIIPEIIRFWGYDFEYQASGSISKEVVNESLIFPLYAPGLLGEDYIKGNIHGLNFEFSEIYALRNKEPALADDEDPEKKYKNNEMRFLGARSENPFFRGIFFVADFHRTFSCPLLLRPLHFKWGQIHFQHQSDGPRNPQYRNAGRLHSEQEASMPLPNLQSIDFNDPEFEAYFASFSNHPSSANSLLTKDLRNRILEFRKKNGKEVFISFKDARLYLAIPYDRPILEPKGTHKEYFTEYLKLSKSAREVLKENRADQEHIMEFFNDLHFLFSFVEELDLNKQS